MAFELLQKYYTSLQSQEIEGKSTGVFSSGQKLSPTDFPDCFSLSHTPEPTAEKGGDDDEDDEGSLLELELSDAEVKELSDTEVKEENEGGDKRGEEVFPFIQLDKEVDVMMPSQQKVNKKQQKRQYSIPNQGTMSQEFLRFLEQEKEKIKRIRLDKEAKEMQYYARKHRERQEEMQFNEQKPFGYKGNNPFKRKNDQKVAVEKQGKKDDESDYHAYLSQKTEGKGKLQRLRDLHSKRQASSMQSEGKSTKKKYQRQQPFTEQQVQSLREIFEEEKDSKSPMENAEIAKMLGIKEFMICRMREWWKNDPEFEEVLKRMKEEQAGFKRRSRRTNVQEKQVLLAEIIEKEPWLTQRGIQEKLLSHPKVATIPIEYRSLKMIRSLMLEMKYERRKIRSIPPKEDDPEMQDKRYKYCKYYRDMKSKGVAEFYFLGEELFNLHMKKEYLYLKIGAEVPYGENYYRKEDNVYAVGIVGLPNYSQWVIKMEEATGETYAEVMRKLMSRVKNSLKHGEETSKNRIILVDRTKVSSSLNYLKSEAMRGGFKVVCLPEKSEQLNAMTYWFSSVKEAFKVVKRNDFAGKAELSGCLDEAIMSLNNFVVEQCYRGMENYVEMGWKRQKI